MYFGYRDTSSDRRIEVQDPLATHDSSRRSAAGSPGPKALVSVAAPT